MGWDGMRSDEKGGTGLVFLVANEMIPQQLETEMNESIMVRRKGRQTGRQAITKRTFSVYLTVFI